MRLTVGLAQFLATPADPRGNLERALGHIASLAAAACDLIVLPELWPCGFSWDTLADDARVAAEPLDGSRGAALAAAAERAGAWLLAGTVPEQTADGVANTAVLYAPDGRLVATHRKVRLYTPLGEQRAFVAGTALTVVVHPQLGPVGIATCSTAPARRDRATRPRPQTCFGRLEIECLIQLLAVHRIADFFD